MTCMVHTRLIHGSTTINHRQNMITCTTMDCTMMTHLWIPSRGIAFVSNNNNNDYFQRRLTKYCRVKFFFFLAKFR